MNRYLLDTNHLSAFLDRRPKIALRIEAAMKSGDRFGICLPVLCEYRAGIEVSKKRIQNLARLQAALSVLRLWPADASTAAAFATIFEDQRAKGTMMSQFDLLIGAIARQHNLTLLTADSDFDRVDDLTIENWL